MENLRIVPGWFNDTVSCQPIEQIVILHIDADWYDSVKTVLQLLYDRVVPGGYVILDDYGLWSGCENAVKDYFAENHIPDLIIRTVGSQAAYFEKPFNKPS